MAKDITVRLREVINSAASDLVSPKGATDLFSRLQKIRSYQKRDPGFEAAINAVAEAEAREHIGQSKRLTP